MDALKRNVSWYQLKIGEFDKQQWEQTVEGKIISSIDNLPKKDITKECRGLLDIDLVKGSTFTKAKPSYPSYIRTWKGLIRLLFMPFFYKWWIHHTSVTFLSAALLLYTAQIFVTLVYAHSSDDISPTTSLFDVTNPLMIMFVLSVIHTQIVFTQSSKSKKQKTILKKASVTFTSPRTHPKRPSKKSKQSKLNKPTKRKSKQQLTTKPTEKLIERENLPEEALTTKCKSSDSSEDIDSAILQENSEHEDLSFVEDLSSEESTVNGPISEKRRPRVEFVPDVAVDAEEKSLFGTVLHECPITAGNESSSQHPTTDHESEGTSDMDTPTRLCTSDTEWETNRVNNSDVASESSSEYESEADQEEEPSVEDPICLKQKVSYSLAYVPSVYDRISCIIWDKGDCKKVDLSVPDLGALIEKQVDNLHYDLGEVFFISIIFTVLIAAFPFLYKLYYNPMLKTLTGDLIMQRGFPSLDKLSEAYTILCGSTWQENVIAFNGFIQRIVLCGVFSFLVQVAERSYWQRLQYVKFFLCLTSARKSKKYAVPHFRLNKVKNIKIWLSLRAYLKKRGPQRSVEVIVSAVFILLVVFLATMCVQLLSDVDNFLDMYGNWELTLCCLALALYLLKFYALGTKIAKKYQCLSTLITEQMNLYLHMEQKPHKKDELMVSSAVLKLAKGLIKEIESPYKIYSTVINPVVFNVMRLAMLSAFSAVLSELLGFKLKLYKVKL